MKHYMVAALLTLGMFGATASFAQDHKEAKMEKKEHHAKKHASKEVKKEEKKADKKM